MTSYSAGRQPFAIHPDSSHPSTVVLQVAGEIDLATAPLISEQWAKLIADRNATQSTAALDFSAVTFLGSTGAAMLLHFLEDSVQEGMTLKLITDGTPAVERPLAVLGLLDLFSVHHDISEAIPLAGPKEPADLTRDRQEDSPPRGRGWIEDAQAG
jgi:anti-anti-sigma factor